MGTILKETVAIVTGSSSGIGKAIALRLAREGAANAWAHSLPIPARLSLSGVADQRH